LAPPHKITSLHFSVDISFYAVLMISLVVAPGLIKPETSPEIKVISKFCHTFFGMTVPNLFNVYLSPHFSLTGSSSSFTDSCLNSEFSHP
jgi:hypothetical protein